MRLYLDASVMVPLLIEEPTTRALRALASEPDKELVVSDFGGAEVSSSISRLVRMGKLSRESGHVILYTFDTWRALSTTRLAVEAMKVVHPGRG